MLVVNTNINIGYFCVIGVEETFNFSLFSSVFLFCYMNNYYLCTKMYLKKEISRRVLLNQHFTWTQAPSLKSHKSISFLRGPMFLGVVVLLIALIRSLTSSRWCSSINYIFLWATVSYRCEDNGWLIEKAASSGQKLYFLFSLSFHSRLAHVLGKVHPLNNSQGKINLLTWPKSSFQFLHKMVQKHQ